MGRARNRTRPRLRRQRRQTARGEGAQSSAV